VGITCSRKGGGRFASFPCLSGTRGGFLQEDQTSEKAAAKREKSRRVDVRHGNGYLSLKKKMAFSIDLVRSTKKEGARPAQRGGGMGGVLEKKGSFRVHLGGLANTGEYVAVRQLCS